MQMMDLREEIVIWSTSISMKFAKMEFGNKLSVSEAHCSGVCCPAVSQFQNTLLQKRVLDINNFFNGSKLATFPWKWILNLTILEILTSEISRQGLISISVLQSIDIYVILCHVFMLSEIDIGHLYLIWELS